MGTGLELGMGFRSGIRNGREEGCEIEGVGEDEQVEAVEWGVQGEDARGWPEIEAAERRTPPLPPPEEKEDRSGCGLA